jgi:hypothetical protein
MSAAEREIFGHFDNPVLLSYDSRLVFLNGSLGTADFRSPGGAFENGLAQAPTPHADRRKRLSHLW